MNDMPAEVNVALEILRNNTVNEDLYAEAEKVVLNYLKTSQETK